MPVKYLKFKETMVRGNRRRNLGKDKEEIAESNLGAVPKAAGILDIGIHYLARRYIKLSEYGDPLAHQMQVMVNEVRRTISTPNAGHGERG